MEIAMEWLIQLGIMTEYADNIGLKEYGIVEWICQNIQYKNEDSIEEELNKLVLAGNAEITARQLKINSGKK